MEEPNMEELILKIQKEVDESNRIAEEKKQKEAPEDDLKFDRDDLLKVNFPNLENAVKYLLKQVDGLTKQVDKVEKNLKSRIYTIDKLFKEGNERDDRVKEANSKIKDLENKSVDLENKQFEFNTSFESFKMNYQIQCRSISSIKERVDELEEFHDAEEPIIKELQQKVSGGAPAKDSSVIQAKGGDNISKEELQKLNERMDSNDVLVNSFINKVKKINEQLSEKQPKLKTPAFNNSDDIENRIKNLERMVNKLGASLPSNDTQNVSSKHADSNIESRVKHLEKDIEDIKSTVPVNTAHSNDETTHSSISYNLKKKIDSMTKEHQELKNAFISIQNSMSNKVDIEQLQEIDMVVTDKLNDCIKAVKRQMHDKSESTKNLKRLERQLRSLYDVLYSQVGASEEEDDPLMGKKTMPLYNMSPYDKKLAGNSSLPKYPVWKKLPPTSKKSRKRSKHAKEMNRMVGNPKADPRGMKYYNVSPMHHTQPEFYDVQDDNM